ncbi:MAG: hypothetical protein HQL44_15055 [Alphaproteobacteria bacterium]|nr:hypothetical protein [Alphaproteobacteria bacterium]
MKLGREKIDSAPTTDPTTPISPNFPNFLLDPNFLFLGNPLILNKKRGRSELRPKSREETSKKADKSASLTLNCCSAKYSDTDVAVQEHFCIADKLFSSQASIGKRRRSPASGPHIASDIADIRNRKHVKALPPPLRPSRPVSGFAGFGPGGRPK